MDWRLKTRSLVVIGSPEKRDQPPMKLKLALLALLCSPLLAQAHSDCELMLQSGLTLQQTMDKLFTASELDPRSLPEQRAEDRAAQLYFDSLCLLDIRIGSHEASVFVREEGERSARMVQALHALDRRKKE
jgi:hypothetical protein